jgi:DNA helicase-2/ATP-dependent DNA helicase PcrA
MKNIDQVLRDELTPEQYAAACDPAGEVLCLACAGSGKSKTLAFRIARLIAQGEDPECIVAFTFTEKAADTIKQRVAKALETVGIDPTILGKLYIGTIHAYCQYILGEMDARYRQFDVLDPNRLKLFLMSRYPQLGLRQLRDARQATTNRNVRYFDAINEVADAWQVMNDEMITVDDVRSNDATMGETLRRLRELLRTNQFMDFSLMIRLVADALRDQDEGVLRAVSCLNHLMVDEYQDVNPAQDTLIRELHKHSTTLFSVGDDDQAVYAWRGADVSNILTFQQTYPNASAHTLSHNFRSTPAIVTAANQFVVEELGAGRITKNPTADVPNGPRDFRKLWFNNRTQEADWVARRIRTLMGTAYEERDGSVRGLTPSDFAVLMSSTRSAEGDGSPRHSAFTQALDGLGISYSLDAGGGIFERQQVSVLRTTFELLRNGNPSRETVEEHFNSQVRPAFPQANINVTYKVLSDWGRRIHAPVGGTRQKLYPQQLVHDLLNAFGISRTTFDDGTMQDLGVFSKIILDVEAVYISIDSSERFADILNFLRNVAETGYDAATGDVLRRPNTVTVSTVHRVKGLEFPVVFVVDVEQGRFPRARSNYEGWLPPNVITLALNRGAYQGTPQEQARVFYTAITRAERYLYVTGSQNLPGGKKVWKPSGFSLRLKHPEISENPARRPGGLKPYRQIRRIDETVVPTSFSEIRYYLRCPKDYHFRKSYGFSPPVAELFGFGKTVHTAIGKLHETFSDDVPTIADAESVARDTFHLKHVFPSRDPVNRPGSYENARNAAVEIIKNYVDEYSDDFAQERQVEARFEISVDQAVISGSIDLLLREDARGKILDARVIDYKTLEGGDEPEMSDDLHWTELALQVQLYSKAAREILDENAKTGHVHLLRDGKRINIPITDKATKAAVANIEWAVARILDDDFPMRPDRSPKGKCEKCDFRALCPQTPQDFKTAEEPSPIHIPGPERTRMARAFSEFEP